ncbi:unnamed protein product, partial [Polarella glacialis]
MWQIAIAVLLVVARVTADPTPEACAPGDAASCAASCLQASAASGSAAECEGISCSALYTRCLCDGARVLRRDGGCDAAVVATSLEDGSSSCLPAYNV